MKSCTHTLRPPPRRRKDVHMKKNREYWQNLKDLHGSAKAIAEAEGIKYQTVYWNLKKHNISSGPKADSIVKLKTIDKSEIIKKYKELNSLQKLGEFYGISGEGLRAYIPQELLVANRMSKIACNEAFFSVDNELSFYYAGFLAADGCLKLKDGKYKQVQFTLAAADGEEVRKFARAIEYASDISDYYTKQCDKYGGQLSRTHLEISSDQIFDDLSRFGLTPRKSLTYQMPEWLPQHQLFHHFLRGYFDGDGGVWIVKPRVNRTIKQVYTNICGTKEFLEQVEQVLDEKLSINGSKKQKKIKLHTGIYSLNYGGNRAAAALHDYIYRDATVWMERKRAILAKAHGWTLEANSQRNSNKKGKPNLKRRRPIIATNLATGEEYHLTGVPEAVERWGLSISGVRDCTRGIQASHRGWAFRYADATNIN